jgi:hypothetical protein
VLFASGTFPPGSNVGKFGKARVEAWAFASAVDIASAKVFGSACVLKSDSVTLILPCGGALDCVMF